MRLNEMHNDKNCAGDIAILVLCVHRVSIYNGMFVQCTHRFNDQKRWGEPTRLLHTCQSLWRVCFYAVKGNVAANFTFPCFPNLSPSQTVCIQVVSRPPKSATGILFEDHNWMLGERSKFILLKRRALFFRRREKAAGRLMLAKFRGTKVMVLP